MGEAEAAAARRVIESGWTSRGPGVEAFEAEVASYLGAARACAVSNCTTALHLALLVSGVGPGDEVITVSHSFVATANSILHCGATPMLVDIGPTTVQHRPRTDRGSRHGSARERSSACTKWVCRAIWNGSCRSPSGMGCPSVEDAACALGREIRIGRTWERVGRPHGDVACFSFHPRKVISMGEGGLVTTRHAAWDERLRLLRQHGMSVPDTVRHASSRVTFEAYPLVGFNYRMTDLQAAIGREQLKRLPGIVRRRR